MADTSPARDGGPRERRHSDTAWRIHAREELGVFCSGGVVSRLTAKPVWFGGGRQLLLGIAAAAVTYGIGTAVGAAGLT